MLFLVALVMLFFCDGRGQETSTEDVGEVNVFVHSQKKFCIHCKMFSIPAAALALH